MYCLNNTKYLYVSVNAEEIFKISLEPLVKMEKHPRESLSNST